jgi:plasmid stability protein
MPSLIVRNIDPEIKERLRMQAARHGRQGGTGDCQR